MVNLPSNEQVGSGRVHEPVLARVVREHLALRAGVVAVDATLDGGGHAAMMLADSAPDGRVLGIERDPDLVERARARFVPEIAAGRLCIAPGSFRDLSSRLREHAIDSVDAVLFDLGVSSFHFDRSSRGFSYQREQPLDMRFDPDEGGPTAADILASRDATGLTRIFRELGEERFASRIARSIVAQRRRHPIRTSGDLVEQIRRSLPAGVRWRWARHAARIFQALRMVVNDELGAIEAALPQAMAALRPGGRLVVISFHSLEDRTVKRTFRAAAQQGAARLLTRKPIRPTEEEVAVNPRAASAKLRAMERNVTT